MRCSNCGHDNRAEAKFCEECGAPVVHACASCGAQLSPTAKFCSECGDPRSTEARQARFTSPETYTPSHLAEKILTSKAALEGERKQVTVLFADLKGSMELLADRDPEEARKLLDPVIERMMEAVHHYEGTVNQVMGDGIMALFGAPLAHEDHAVRACHAALRMQESVARYAEGVFRSHGVPIQIRVGLNSGEVVVRAIGSDLHMDYTAVGRTTHLAARMEQMATPGTILLAPATLQLVEGYVQVAACGPVAVKGLPDAVEIYTLTGASAQRTRLHAAAVRGLTRFVGRDAEIELLRQALGLAHDGHGQLVAIVGEPGVGKSRLVYEFIHSHRTQDWLVLEASSVSYGKATSYLPVIDLLKAYFKVHDRETHREIREKVTGKLLTLDESLKPALPALLALLDVPVEDAPWQALDPAERQQRTLDAVKHLLLRESQRQPVLVVVEDLHWIDAETRALLDNLVESLPTVRVLLLVNYRPEVQHGWGRKTYYSRLRLDALPAESAGKLLNVLLGDDSALEPLKRLLVKRGNPFFIEESIRTLVETGALARERGAYRLTRPIQAIEVPATVQVILAARIDRLSAEDKLLLQAASVIGKDVPILLLHAVAEAAEDAVQRGLTHLQAAEFLYETRLYPEPEYTFKHALTHDVTYGTLLQDRRKVLHARIVGAIERSYPERLAEHVERLAHHACRGEVWDKALTYLRQVAAKAQRRAAYQQALVCLEEAVQVLRHLPETPETREQEVDVRLELRGSLYPLGEFEKMLTYLSEAETIASALADAHRLGLVSIHTAEYFRQTGRFAEARTLAQKALAMGEKLQDVPLQIHAGQYFALACHALGDYRRASEVLRAVTQTPRPERRALGMVPSWDAHQAISLAWLARCLAEIGEFNEGVPAGRRAVALAEGLEIPYSLTAACIGLGYICLVKGDLDVAGPVLDRACNTAREANLTLLRPQATRLLGHAYILAGRIDEGVALVREAVNEVESRLLLMQHAAVLSLLAEACLVASRLDEASTVGQRALNLARDGGQRGEEAVALRVLGDIATHPDQFDAESGETHFRQALALAEELGMRPLVAHCNLGLGRLHRRNGNRGQAEEHLSTATAMYREIGMAYWLEQAESELQRLR
jgi:class 3 adenylate cyclase/tetratricopeptide (TPR) repeat protein